jgi:hypothetical protein
MVYHIGNIISVVVCEGFGFESGFAPRAFLSTLIFQSARFDRLFSLCTDFRFGLGIVLILVVSGRCGAIEGAVGKKTSKLAAIF